MITKAEREQDRAICEAATKGAWLTFGGETPGERVRIKHLDKQSGYLTIAEVLGWDRIPENAAAIVNAVNRLPAYIADAEEMERRIETLGALARALEAGEVAVDGVEHVPEAMRYAVTAGAIGGLQMAIAILRGEP